jgi:hypothetical protein
MSPQPEILQMKIISSDLELIHNFASQFPNKETASQDPPNDIHLLECFHNIVSQLPGEEKKFIKRA